MHTHRAKRNLVIAVSAICLIAGLLAWFGVFTDKFSDGFQDSSTANGVVPTPSRELAYVGPLSDPSKSTLGTEKSDSARPLKLFATIRGRNAREGAARMGAYAENPQTYMAGALLGSGARLLEIYDEYVVLERDGKLQKVFIEGSGRRAEAGDLHIVAASGDPKGQSTVSAGSHVVVPDLTDYIRPSAVYELDRLKGLRVYSGRRSHIFSQWGLQDGDLIVSMNGRIGDVASAMETLSQLTKGGVMTITVERSGAIQTLYLDGTHVVADAASMNQTIAAVPPAAPY